MNFKRIFASALISLMVFSNTAFADDIKPISPFNDVNIETSQGKAIVKMFEKGYLKGYEDGTFKPGNSITRAELTRVFNQVFGYNLNEETAVSMKDFTDNFDTTAWYYNDVRIAQSNGYIKGFEDGSFRPKSNFTREQTCTVIYAAAKLEDKEVQIEINDPVSQWAKTYVNANINNGVFSLEQGNLFRAKENITRGEVCEALVKFVKDNTSVDNNTIITDNKDNSTENTTTSNKETTTETTTKSSSTAGGGGGGGGGGGATTVEPTIETTTINPADIEMNEDQMDAYARIIRKTKNEFIPICYKAEQKAIAKKVLAALEAYYADRNYDFRGDIEEAKSMYNQMSKADRDEFKNKALSIYTFDDYGPLMPLFEAFL